MVMKIAGLQKDKKIGNFFGGSVVRWFDGLGSMQNHGLTPHDFTWTVEEVGDLL